MRVGEAGKQIGVSSSTVRSYCNQGLLEYSLNPAGQRVISQEAIDSFMGRERVEVLAHYVRSSSGDSKLMDSQLEELVSAYGEGKVYKDRASGLNDKRPGLWKLIKDAEQGKYNTLCVTYRDRLTRFDYRFVEYLLVSHGVKINVLHDDVSMSLEDELLGDFMSIISVFSGKFYRLRSKENKIKLLDKAIKEINA